MYKVIKIKSSLCIPKLIKINYLFYSTIHFLLIFSIFIRCKHLLFVCLTNPEIEFCFIN